MIKNTIVIKQFEYTDVSDVKLQKHIDKMKSKRYQEVSRYTRGKTLVIEYVKHYTK